MRDYVYDETTGENVAWIENGRVHAAKSGLEIGQVKDGRLFSPTGADLGALWPLQSVSTPSGKPSDDFLAACRAADHD